MSGFFKKTAFGLFVLSTGLSKKALVLQWGQTIGSELGLKPCSLNAEL